MNIWFVVPTYEGGAWVSEDEEADLAYASEKAAIRAKEAFDAADYELHQMRDTKRIERHTLYRTARSILEANGFAEVDQVLPPREDEPGSRRFETRYDIIKVKVKE